MIIVEGADNVGKTTLIRQLVEMDPALRILHRDRFNPKRGETIATSYLNTLLPADGDRVAHGYGIADRFLASEHVYGTLFRGGSRISLGEARALQAILRGYDAMIVWCDPPDEAILSTWTKRDQLYDDPLVIAREYRRVVREVFPQASVFRYDWTAPGAEALRQGIVETHRRHAQAIRRRLSWWSAMPYGIGHLDHPRLIFVGYDNGSQSRAGVPFFTGASADFLTRVLADVARELPHFDAHAVYITDAWKGHPRVIDAAMLREELFHLAWRDTTIVTMGAEASVMFEAIAPSLAGRYGNHVRVPHPLPLQCVVVESYADEIITALQGGN